MRRASDMVSVRGLWSAIANGMASPAASFHPPRQTAQSLAIPFLLLLLGRRREARNSIRACICILARVAPEWFAVCLQAVRGNLEGSPPCTLREAGRAVQSGRTMRWREHGGGRRRMRALTSFGYVRVES